MISIQQDLPLPTLPVKLPANKKSTRLFFIKLFNWEYWSFSTVYFPIYFYWLYLCVRARSLFFFSASNPTIENGGFVMERKSDIYDIMPKAYYPKTLLVKEGLTTAEITNLIKEKCFQFPIIVKPDIGGKGRGVRKIENMEDAVAYIQYANFPMLVQTLVDYKYEAGIFYYRFPWEENGRISGIVAKEFLTVIGDGNNSIEGLVMQNPRFILQLDALRRMPEINLQEVLPLGKEKVMVPFGNHARGAKFIDASNLITPTLEKNIDAICKQIPGFYFGRLDIMFTDWQELTEGKNLSIIELNGAGSEPTHIYDPAHSIFFAWKEIARHLKLLYRISVWNHRHQQAAYLPFKVGLKIFTDVKVVERKLDGLL